MPLQCGANAFLVGAAFVGVDCVSEGVDRLGVPPGSIAGPPDAVARAMPGEADDRLVQCGCLVRFICCTKSLGTATRIGDSYGVMPQLRHP